MNLTVVDDPVHAVFRALMSVTTVADLVMQLYTIFLVLRVATSSLQQYRYFMLLCSVCDTLLALCLGVLLRIRPLTPQAGCGVVEGPLSALGLGGARLALPLIYFFGAALIASQVYCVVYRTVSVLDNQGIKRVLLRPVWIISFLSVILTVGAAMAVGMFMTTLPIDDGWLGMYRQQGLIKDTETAVFCVHIRVPDVIISITIWTVFVSAEVFSVACGIWIVRKVKSHASLSSKTKQLHLQLTRLIVAQMLCPCLFMLVPALVYGSTIVVHLDLTVTLYYLILITVSLFPLANACLAIYFVTPYRRFTLQMLCFCVNGGTEGRSYDFSDASNSRLTRVQAVSNA